MKTILSQKKRVFLALIILIILSSCKLSKKKSFEKAAHNYQNDSVEIISDTTLKQEKISIITPLENEFAPEFNLLDKNGETVTTNDLLKHKKKLLVFTDRTCDHCIAFYPVLEKFAKKYKDDFYIVTIQYDTNLEQLKKITSEKKYHFDMLSANDAVFIDYKITGTPTIMLLDDKNFIQKNRDGLFSLQELEQLFIEIKV